MADVARIHYEIPEDVHRRAKAAAAMRGQSLKDFLIDALTEAVTKADKKSSGR